MNPLAPTASLLYLDARGVSAWRPGRGGLRFLGRYRHGEATDARDLCEVLGRWPNAPVRLLVETIEEDFRTVDVPHVLGTARGRLRQRSLERTFPSAAFRRVSSHGRRRSGRRDDILLLSALERFEELSFWLEALNGAGVPLEGLYTSGYLIEAGRELLDLPRSGAVLLSIVLAAGLRQIFLLDGRLRFSRLVLDAEGETRERPLVERERGRIEVFLRNQQLLPRGVDLVQRSLGVPPAPVPRSYIPSIDEPQTSPELLDEPVSRRLRLPTAPADGQLGDLVLLTLLAGGQRGGAYALPRGQARAAEVLRWRRAIHAAAGMAGAFAAVLAGNHLLEGRQVGAQLEQTQAQQAGLRRQLAELRRAAPDSDVPAEIVRAVVDLDLAMMERAPQPERLMRAVAGALATTPGVVVDELAWRVPDARGPGAGPGAQGDPAARLPARVGLERELPRAELEFSGQLPLELAEGDLRRLVADFDSLLRQLRAAGLEIEVLDRPLDVSAAVGLRLDAGTLAQPKNDFALRVWLAAGEGA